MFSPPKQSTYNASYYGTYIQLLKQSIRTLWILKFKISIVIFPLQYTFLNLKFFKLLIKLITETILNIDKRAFVIKKTANIIPMKFK